MKCEGCGNESALRLNVRYAKEGKRETCEKCGTLDVYYNPDVTVPVGGYYDEHLDTFIYSKRQKARLLKERNIVEVADRVNPVLGRPMPYIADAEKRRKFCLDNFGK